MNGTEVTGKREERGRRGKDRKREGACGGERGRGEGEGERMGECGQWIVAGG